MSEVYLFCYIFLSNILRRFWSTWTILWHNGGSLPTSVIVALLFIRNQMIYRPLLRVANFNKMISQLGCPTDSVSARKLFCDDFSLVRCSVRYGMRWASLHNSWNKSKTLAVLYGEPSIDTPSVTITMYRGDVRVPPIRSCTFWLSRWQKGGGNYREILKKISLHPGKIGKPSGTVT